MVPEGLGETGIAGSSTCGQGSSRGPFEGGRAGWLALWDETRHRDRTAECRRTARRRLGHGPSSRRGCHCGDPATFRADGHGARLEARDNGPVAVGPKDAGAGRSESVHGHFRRVPIRVAGSGRSHGHLRSHGLDERLGGGRPAPMVGDLEQVEERQAGREQGGIDPVLHVSHQQETPPAHLAEQDDRHIVDPRPAVGWFKRDLAGDWPQDTNVDLVDGQPIALRQAEPDRCSWS
jgi:hypothetical protein